MSYLSSRESMPLNNRKVGILNFQYSNHNYGAVLQAAALEFTLKILGYNATHIDFMAPRPLSFRSIVGKALRYLGLRKNLKANQVGNEQAFEKFRQSFVHRTRRIKTASKFTKIAKNFDAVVVGSDQVWRLRMAGDPIAFFLGYVPDGVDRISYAASFGLSSWDLSEGDKLTEIVRKELGKFKAISCRENSGVDICREIFGIHAIHVLDPLLLVDQSFYERVLAFSKTQKECQVVYYKLDADEDFVEDLKLLEEHYGIAMVNIYLKNSNLPEYQEVSDWLGLIYGANVIVTDSYHCICLALLFGKEVIYCPNPSRGQARLDSLFEMLTIDLVPFEVQSRHPMYKLSRRIEIDAILEKKREEALLFLKRSIGA